MQRGHLGVWTAVNHPVSAAVPYRSPDLELGERFDFHGIDQDLV
jgi:hypothetical protein